MPPRPRDIPTPTVNGSCARCGRVVAGFPGDLVRCGNCRHMTPLPLSPPGGWRLVRDPSRLTALPFYFVLLFYASMVAIVWTSGGTDLLGGAVVVVVFALWIFSIMQFARAAEHQRGWWTPVLFYHVASLAMPACFWLGVRGCSPLIRGDLGLAPLLHVAASLVGLLVCLLVYGAARGRTARLRVVRA